MPVGRMEHGAREHRCAGISGCCGNYKDACTNKKIK